MRQLGQEEVAPGRAVHVRGEQDILTVRRELGEAEVVVRGGRVVRMREQPPLSVRGDEDDPTGREPGAAGRLQAAISKKRRPLVIEIGGMLDPIPAAVNGGAVGGPAEKHARIQDARGEHRELIRETQVPVDDDPAVAQAGEMGERNPGISRGAPGDGVRTPVPHHEPVVR